MKFTAEYYHSGNYKNYLTRRFDALAKDIQEVCGLTKSTMTVDFGCGFGGLVNALYNHGVKNITGTDISTWAIDHGKLVFPHIAKRLHHYNRNLLVDPHDSLIMLDVLEHMPEYEAESVLRLARSGLRGKAIFRIPVASVEGHPFVLQVSNNDPTHINCHTKDWWHILLNECGFNLVSVVDKQSIYASDGVISEVWE